MLDFSELEDKISHIRFQHTKNLLNKQSDHCDLTRLDDIENRINHIKRHLDLHWVKICLIKALEIFSQDYLRPKLIYDFTLVMKILLNNVSMDVIREKIENVPDMNLII